MTNKASFLTYVLILASLIYSCSGHPKNTDHDVFEGNETVSTGNDSTPKSLLTKYQNIKGRDSVKFRIDTYSNNLTFLSIQTFTGFVLAASGSSNIELLGNLDRFAIKTSFALNDSCYLIDFIHSGSTYGANLSIIAWYGYNKWNLFTLPFERFDIKDIDNDNLVEIINYHPSMQVYRFSSGCLSKR